MDAAGEDEQTRTAFKLVQQDKVDVYIVHWQGRFSGQETAIASALQFRLVPSQLLRLGVCPMRLYSALLGIWNPDHLDKNWQIGTYVSVQCTDMYVNVYEVTYRHEHVCTCYKHVHIYTDMYIP